MTDLSSTLSPAARLPAAGLLAALLAAVARYRRNRRLRSVMDLDDHLLRDIGLTRGDIAMMQDNERPALR